MLWFHAHLVWSTPGPFRFRRSAVVDYLPGFLFYNWVNGWGWSFINVWEAEELGNGLSNEVL